MSVAVLFHELGHALCAVHEGAPLCSVGILCFLCCPGAFVKMDLARLTDWGKIRTFSAGVWHNLILAVFCYFIIQYRDLIFAPFYSRGLGFVVHEVAPDSSISGEYGIGVGDVIDEINNCDFNKNNDLNGCISHIRTTPQLGFCEFRIDNQFETNFSNCCPTENMTHICFQSNFNESLEKYGCLHARKIIESSTSFCNTNQDCKNGMSCIVPTVNETYHERLLIIKHGNERVLFLGDPFELNPPTLILINLVPRHWLISKYAPVYILKFVDYVLVYSLGMAFFNSLPCIILDGNHISTSLIELATQCEDRRLLLRIIVNTIGTMLIFIFTILQFIRMAIS